MFEITLSPSALDDVAWFSKRERRAVLDAIEDQLSNQPDVVTRSRKRLRPNRVAEWELRSGAYRVFYDVTGTQRLVEIKMVGLKAGSKLLIRGQEYTL